jgi:hypothetical protein
MKRALLPWLFPVAMILGLLLALTNSLIVFGLVVMVSLWVVLPLGLAAVRRSGGMPHMFQGDGSANLPRWARLHSDRDHRQH